MGDLPFRRRSLGRPSICAQKGRRVWQSCTLTASAPTSVGACWRCCMIWFMEISVWVTKVRKQRWREAQMVKMTKRWREALRPNAAANQHRFPHRWPLHHQWPVRHPLLQHQEQRQQGNLPRKRMLPLRLSRTRPRMMRSWGNSWLSATSGCERCNSSHRRIQAASFFVYRFEGRTVIWKEKGGIVPSHSISLLLFTCFIHLCNLCMHACIRPYIFIQTYRHTLHSITNSKPCKTCIQIYAHLVDVCNIYLHLIGFKGKWN